MAAAQQLSGALLAFLAAKKSLGRKMPKGAKFLPRKHGAGGQTSPGALAIAISDRRTGKINPKRK